MNRHYPLIVIAALAVLAWATVAAADVPGHISYQGMLTDGGTPFTGEANFKFALVDTMTGDYFWTNDGSHGPPSHSVRLGVEGGVFSVLLGAPPMAPIDPQTIANYTRDQALRIWVELGSHGEMLLGNLPLSSVLFAHQAELARASAGDFTAQGEIWSQSGGFRFPDGTLQATAATGGGGAECPWSTGIGGRIYYNAGNVGTGPDHPDFPLSIQKSFTNNIFPMALYRTTGTGSAAAVRFQNALDNHFNLGITGASHLALGYNMNIGLAGDVLRVTPDGNVGIGRTSPAARLDVNGSVRMTGLQLGTSATVGHVLTADASGVGTWQPAPTGGGGGDCFWSAGTSGRIYYNGGYVGIGNDTPLDRLHLGHVDDDNSFVRITSGANTGVRFAGASGYDGEIRYDRADNSMRFAVRATAGVPERLRITTEGNVGIGTTTPTARLHVNGTARMNGFQLGSSTTAGHVLTTDASGVGTWQPAPAGGGEGFWSAGDGGSIHYSSGYVGIGTGGNAPGQLLEVGNTSTANNYIRLAAVGTSNSGIQFWDGQGTFSGMLQYAHSDNSLRLLTRSGSTAAERLRITSGGNIGMGTSSPTERLHVNGTIRMNGLQLGTSATPGHVLTAGADGRGTWQAPTGGGGGGDFSLPYEGETSDEGAALYITNLHPEGVGIQGVGQNIGVYGSSSSGTAGTGVLGNSSSGWGVSGTSTTGIGVRARATGAGGVGVEGVATPQAAGGIGGRFEANAATHRAVYATSTLGTAIEAVSDNVALKASGSQAAAEFYGNLKIYEHGTSNLVLELGKGLDYAEGFNVSTADDLVGPGTVLVIDSANPGMLAISTQAYDRRVAGIVSGANNLGAGVRLGGDMFDHDVALAGRVYCNVIAGAEPIQPGDLLTTSHVPGYAMKVTDGASSTGAILGKAMEPLAAGQRGLILVLVTLQ